MRVLITGAAGCLGQGVVNALAQLASCTVDGKTISEKIEIFATDIKENPFTEQNQEQTQEQDKSKYQHLIHYQKHDLRDDAFFQWLDKIQPTKIIHLASILQISKYITREIAYEIDVVATKKLLKKAVALNVEKFIVTTSGAAYGYYPENKRVITEDRATKGNSDYFYSAHKAEVEDIMAQYRQQHPELKQIVFRPGAIIGPNFTGPVVNLFQQKVIVGLLGYPGPFNFIWSEDVIAYLIEGITSNICGQFNIAGDGILSMKDIANTLKKPYLALPAGLIQAALAIAKPLGLSQYGPEQVKFIKYRPVLANDKIKATFTHQPKYTSKQALDAFLQIMPAK